MPADFPPPQTGSSHTGEISSGIGLAANSFLDYCAVPAYICRYSFDRNINAILARNVGVDADRCQIALQL